VLASQVEVGETRTGFTAQCTHQTVEEVLEAPLGAPDGFVSKSSDALALELSVLH